MSIKRAERGNELFLGFSTIQFNFDGGKILEYILIYEPQRLENELS
jgi:hypothetical protein